MAATEDEKAKLLKLKQELEEKEKRLEKWEKKLTKREAKLAKSEAALAALATTAASPSANSAATSSTLSPESRSPESTKDAKKEKRASKKPRKEPKDAPATAAPAPAKKKPRKPRAKSVDVPEEDGEEDATPDEPLDSPKPTKPAETTSTASAPAPAPAPENTKAAEPTPAAKPAAAAPPPIPASATGPVRSPSATNTKIPVVDKSSQKLTAMPADLAERAESIVKLYIFKNSIASMGPDIGKCNLLQLIDANNNALTEFPEALTGLPKLTDINFSDNFITKFPANLGKMALTKLDLTGNGLKEFPLALITLGKLSTLILNHNQIRTVPKEIGQMTALTVLHASNNKIESLPQEFGDLEALGHLSLNYNRLATLPATVTKLGALQVLELSRNKLSELPACLHGKLPYLQHCNVSWNSIREIKDDFFDDGTFDSFEELILAHNKIKKIPEALFIQMTNLTVFDAKNNRLKEIPASIGNLVVLNTLDLGGNALESLPDEVANLATLQHLIVFGNKLSTLPPLAGQLYYLTQLNLAHNKLTSDAIDVTGFDCLEELYLGGNEITTLQEDIGDLCQNLRLLSVNDAKLTSLPESLANLPGLEQLDVSHNELTEIPTFLSRIESLRVITFHHNKLTNTAGRKDLKDAAEGDGPWDCVDNWRSFMGLVEVDVSFNQLQYLPAGLKDAGDRVDVIVDGNPLVDTEKPKSPFVMTESKRFKFGVAETIGRRPTMEDRFCLHGSLGGKDDVDLFALFDGHAGREAADFAARKLPDVLASKIVGGVPDWTKTISDTFEEVHNAFKVHVQGQRGSQNKHCGCTAVVVLIVGSKVHVANVGDSRCVTSSGKRLTVDHKPRLEASRIRHIEGGYVTGEGWGRVNGILAVSRSLGDFYMSPWVIPTPHTTTVELADLKYLIIACDGVWDEVEDDKASAIVEDMVSQGKLEEAAGLLRDTAYAFGSDDNISVLLVKLA